MKRHESLAPLSREHHSALILAQLLKSNAPEYKGMPTSVHDKIVYAVNMYTIDLKRHFKKEEAMLSEIRSFHPAIAAMENQIVAEHNMLTALFLSLEKVPDQEATMNRLGTELENHIRKEERILFPLIQEYCPEDTLIKLEGLLS